MAGIRTAGIQIKNLRLRAQSGSTYLDQALYCALADGLVLRNIAVEGYASKGFSVQSCRDVLVEDCQVGGMDPSRYATGGYGYGVQIQRCTKVLVQRIRGNSNRHLVTIFASASGRTLDCTEEASHGTFPDFHGYGEEDWQVSGTSITAAATSGNADAAFGNGTYPYGCSNVTCHQHTGGAICYLYAGTSNFQCTGVAWSAAVICYSTSAGRPTSAVFVDCSSVGFDLGGAVAASAVRFDADGATHGITSLTLIRHRATDVAGANARGLYVPSVAVNTTITIEGGSWGNSAGTYAMEADHSGAGTLTLAVSGSPTYVYSSKAWRLAGSGGGSLTGVPGVDVQDDSTGISPA